MNKRPLIALAVALGFFAGGHLISDAATGDLLRTNNSGGNQTLVPKIPGTPCWRLGSQTFRPDGTPFSACTPTTSTTVAPTTTTTVAPTTTTTIAPTSTTTSTTTQPPVTTSTVPSGAQFVETFDGNSGLDRFTWGVYHRGVAHTWRGTPEPVDGVNNNIGAVGNWSADHDLACGDAHSQRPLSTEWQQDTTGANGFKPLIWPHVDELIYVCRDHVMSSMGDVSGFSVLWFAPDQAFTDVSSVSFDVNLTDLGDRQWWKVGVVTDSAYQSMCPTYGGSSLQVPCHVRSDVGSSDLTGEMEDADVLIATWSGGASHAGRFGMAIGATPVPCGFNAGSDKMTRFPVSLVDNGNGTVTFTVAGSSCTTAAAFPACPCRVIFYDQNYNPNKDGMPIGHTWHWDSIVID